VVWCGVVCCSVLCFALLCCAVLCYAVLCCLFCLFAPFPARWPQFGGGGEPGPLGSPSPTAYAGANVAPAPRHEPVRSQLLNPRVTANYYYLREGGDPTGLRKAGELRPSSGR